MKRVLEWAAAEGREKDISAELREAVRPGQLSGADIERRIAEMEAARARRDFKASDAIRAETQTAAGIIIEITKDGVRWRRK
jgi:cysteinyl-tRNA synthetase